MAETTIYTLARELNMTPSMISRAFSPNAKISEDKRRLVLETAEKKGFVPNKLASRLSMKKVRIGVIVNSRFKINTDKMLVGFESAYSKLKDYKIEYDVKVMNPLKNTFEEYSEAIDSFKDYDGVILTGMSATKYTDLINTLYKSCPSIVQVQAVNNEASHLFASKHDEKSASSLASEFLYNCLKRSSSKNVILFTGDLDTTLHKSAADAFCEECKKHSLNLTDIIDMKDDASYFEKILPDMYRKLCNTDGIYITSGISSPLCKFLERERLDAFLVAFDTHCEIKSYMEKGVISATISQDVSRQAESAFELLVKHIISGAECPETIYTDVQLVLKSNINQFN